MKEEKLISCPYCESVNIDDKKVLYCRNCEGKITSHEKQSLSSAWAMLITAMVFYVIANIYPILEVNKFGHITQNTIIGGAVVLWEEGSYPIAIIIFIASVFVPLLKFILILYILINYKMPQKGSKKVDQEKLYHFTELIGPWSMIDVFVVAILAGVVNMHSVKIYAGVGATAFVLMVFFTMLATLSIDYRIIKEKKDGNKRASSRR
jgi:paraquat-inducible protein A